MTAERKVRRTEEKSIEQPYREWVERQAAAGDAAAISQLRGWAYAAKREGAGRAANGKFVNVIRHHAQADPVTRLDLPGTRHRVRRDGAVNFSFDGLSSGFVDHGATIELRGDVLEEATLVAALTHARGKFGNDYVVEGDEQFSAAIMRLEAKHPGDRELAEAWHTSEQQRRAMLNALRKVKGRSPTNQPT